MAGRKAASTADSSVAVWVGSTVGRLVGHWAGSTDSKLAVRWAETKAVRKDENLAALWGTAMVAMKAALRAVSTAVLKAEHLVVWKEQQRADWKACWRVGNWVAAKVSHSAEKMVAGKAALLE